MFIEVFISMDGLLVGSVAEGSFVVLLYNDQLSFLYIFFLLFLTPFLFLVWFVFRDAIP